MLQIDRLGEVSVYLIFQSDLPGNSTDKDVHYERIGGMED